MEKKAIVSKKIPFYLAPFRYLYRRISSLMFSDVRIIQITSNGIKYLLWANEDIGKRMIVQRQYEQGEMRAFAQLVRPGDVCVDVGGNVGIYSLNFAKLCTPTGRVYVVEPISRNRLVIMLAAEINSLPNISVFPYALSSGEGEVELEIPSVDGAYAFIRPVGASGAPGTTKIRSLAFSKLLEEEHIERVDILKIDVEGAEKLVLDGALEVLADKCKRPRVMMIELVDEFLGRYGSTVAEVLSIMGGIGYSAYYADANGRLRIFSEQDINRIFNVFFLLDRA
ncbi:MAG: FkbM family methyltransferase [Porticoccaceae bacterium]